MSTEGFQARCSSKGNGGGGGGTPHPLSLMSPPHPGAVGPKAHSNILEAKTHVSYPTMPPPQDLGTGRGRGAGTEEPPGQGLKGRSTSGPPNPPGAPTWGSPTANTKLRLDETTVQPHSQPSPPRQPGTLHE